MASNQQQNAGLKISYPVDTITVSDEGYSKARSISKQTEHREKANPKKLHRLLVVEDDEITQEVLGLFLQDIYDIDYASSANEAIELVRANDYMAVLMDINLGRGKSGLFVTNEIRNMKGKERLPIIAQTAFAMGGDKEEFLEAGCDYYLSKPFTKTELRDVLSEIKEKHK